MANFKRRVDNEVNQDYSISFPAVRSSHEPHSKKLEARSEGSQVRSPKRHHPFPAIATGVFFAGTGDPAVAAADLRSARILYTPSQNFQPAGVRRDKKYQKNSLSPAFPFYIPPGFYEIGFRLNHGFCFSQNEKEEISKCRWDCYIQTYIHFYIQKRVKNCCFFAFGD